jgi:hypothetical protein
MTKENVLKSCYSVLGRYTPLDFDCGMLCGGECCKGDENTGMLLFPGEEKLVDPSMTIKEMDDGTLVAVCNGTCDRRKRPLSCRIYPVFPLIIENDGKEYVEVDFDERARCPLTKGDITLDRRFCKAVKRVGKYLQLNEETASFYRSLSDEINEYIELGKIFSKKS